jgi:uncharacterized protein YjbI with pentapeptide repeats
MIGNDGGAEEDKGQRRALIISISQYDKLEPLDFCEADGNKMYEVLIRLGYDIPIKNRLIGGRVEYDKLRESIYDFFYAKSIDPKDTILFYFSGHGVTGDDGEHYLSTSEIDPDIPHRRGISFDFLTKAREDCNSKTIFTILDCCYAGADKPGARGEDDSANIAKDVIKKKSSMQGEGKCILAACKPMQKAYELKEKGHGIFTFYLAEALSNYGCADEDGNITPYMLSDYIDNRIRSLPSEIRPKQTPLLNCSTSGKIILAQFKKPKAKKPSDKATKPTIDRLVELLVDEKIEEFNKLRREEDIPLYLSKLNLGGKRLIGVDLHEANLAETKLNNAKLIDANLNGANLKNSDLSGANFMGANLNGANLSGANLSKADLRSTDLKGMIDFSGANLTGADVRGVDLNGMVNFSGAILHDIDFSGSVTDKGLINLSGADISNVRGLHALQPHKNEYLNALNSFSESIKQQFKAYDIPTEQVKSIEESMKALVKEVEDLGDKEDLSSVEKQNLRTKFLVVIEEILRILPKTSQHKEDPFASLEPFSKLIGETFSKLIGESIHQLAINKGNALRNEGKYNEAIEYYDKALEINPNYADALNGKGNALRNKGKYNEAIEYYDKALEINPRHPYANSNISLALDKLEGIKSEEGKKSGWKRFFRWTQKKLIRPTYTEEKNRGL